MHNMPAQPEIHVLAEPEAKMPQSASWIRFYCCPVMLRCGKDLGALRLRLKASQPTTGTSSVRQPISLRASMRGSSILGIGS